MGLPALAMQFESHEVRIVDRDGSPWWVLADVCAALEIGNPAQAASRLDDDEKGDITIDDITGRQQQMLIVSEPGLYKLIMTSRKAAAQRFNRWVRHDVLPAIRKTGSYGAPKSEMAQLTEMFIEGMKQAIAPLGVRLEDQDKAIERIDRRIDNVAEDVASIKARLLNGRRHLTKATKAEHVDAIRRLGGLCPCCSQSVVVVNGVKSSFSQFDHFYQNSRPNVEHTWLICTPCHTKLSSGQVPRDQVEAEFRAYQNRRRRLPNRQMTIQFETD